MSSPHDSYAASEPGDETPVFGSIEEELEYWKSRAEELKDSFQELQNDYEDLQESSTEIEQEIEKDLQQTERKLQAIQGDAQRSRFENDELKTRFAQSNAQAAAQINQFRKEIDNLREKLQQLQQLTRRLEQDNDDLERKQRAAEYSENELRRNLEDVEEHAVLVEEEMEEQRTMHEELVQRLKEELRDLKNEVTVRTNDEIVERLNRELSELKSELDTLRSQPHRASTRLSSGNELTRKRALSPGTPFGDALREEKRLSAVDVLSLAEDSKLSQLKADASHSSTPEEENPLKDFVLPSDPSGAGGGLSLADELAAATAVESDGETEEHEERVDDAPQRQGMGGWVTLDEKEKELVQCVAAVRGEELASNEKIRRRQTVHLDQSLSVLLFLHEQEKAREEMEREKDHQLLGAIRENTSLRAQLSQLQEDKNKIQLRVMEMERKVKEQEGKESRALESVRKKEEEFVEREKRIREEMEVRMQKVIEEAAARLAAATKQHNTIPEDDMVVFDEPISPGFPGASLTTASSLPSRGRSGSLPEILATLDRTGRASLNDRNMVPVVQARLRTPSAPHRPVSSNSSPPPGELWGDVRDVSPLRKTQGMPVNYASLFSWIYDNDGELNREVYEYYDEMDEATLKEAVPSTPPGVATHLHDIHTTTRKVHRLVRMDSGSPNGRLKPDDQDSVSASPGKLSADYVRDREMEMFRMSLITGREFLKYGRRGKPHKRFIWYDVDLNRLYWSDPKGSKGKRDASGPFLMVSKLTDVKPGIVTPVMRRNGDPTKAHLYLSLFSQSRTLDLELDSREERDMWLRVFQSLLFTSRRRSNI